MNSDAFTNNPELDLSSIDEEDEEKQRRQLINDFEAEEDSLFKDNDNLSDIDGQNTQTEI